jgi:hypothetical protein
MDLKELQSLAQATMAEHGLGGWTFRFGRSKRRLGMCDHRRKCIEIAAYYAYFTPEGLVKDTLLHEVAHALAGPGAGHGPKWKAVAARIGATPKACDDSEETVVPPGDWQAVCPGCSKTHYRYRRPMTLSGYRCRCVAKSPLTFTFRGQPVPESAARPAPWKATCSGCGITHKRVRRPKAGLWRCGCPKKGELKWTWSR